MPILVVQMGHSGRTSGATGAPGEKQFTEQVGAACRALLDGQNGWAVRTIPADVSNTAYRGDAFVAIHADGNNNPDVCGSSVGYQTNAGAGLAHGWQSAYAGLGWTGPWHLDNYTTNLAQYYGVRIAVQQGNTRAFIAECGTITNPAEHAAMTGPGGPERVAEAIGIALSILTPTKPKQEDDVALATVQWEPGEKKWGVLSIPPVGASTSIPAGGRAWLHLRVPHQSVVLHGLWCVKYNGVATALVSTDWSMPHDAYNLWQLPNDTMQVSALYTGVVPIGAQIEAVAA